MSPEIKRKTKGRVLTILSKISELKQMALHDIDDDIYNILPDLEKYEQELMSAYSELT